MKKIYTLILGVAVSFQGQAQIPNAGFENWSSGLPLEWFASNSGSNIFVLQDANAHSGSLAARVQTVTATTTTAVAFYTRSSTGTPWFAVGMPARPTNLEFWAITNLNGGDVLRFTSALKDPSGLVIGVINGTCLSTNSATYQHYSFPIHYSSGANPDSGNINFIFYNGGCSTFNTAVQPGTFVILDDLAYTIPTGIETENETGFNASVYPNPASTISYLDYDAKENASITFQLVDMMGKEVKNFGVFDQPPGNHTYAFDVSDLVEGIYFYRIKSDSGMEYKKLIVNK